MLRQLNATVEVTEHQFNTFGIDSVPLFELWMLHTVLYQHMPASHIKSYHLFTLYMVI